MGGERIDTNTQTITNTDIQKYNDININTKNKSISIKLFELSGGCSWEEKIKKCKNTNTEIQKCKSKIKAGQHYLSCLVVAAGRREGKNNYNTDIQKYKDIKTKIQQYKYKNQHYLSCLVGAAGRREDT